ncbi:ROK family protein [Kineosporia sp. NBRC 101731]|uniref:ROK family protein n=1 Tax=Kineosporia sp. NBRC 101731 TaxID=3032199 RepID=UPI0024A0FD1A|nr:ROK family protein [Kineosporia sp. NBRC 101731]GLY31063.1 sugar kinase [Kineosporia sp. NBRC 101731]
MDLQDPANPVMPSSPVWLQVPPLSARVSPEVIASTLARLISSGTATSKADLSRLTGLARSTVDTGIRTLESIGAVRVGGLQHLAGRGRPAEALEIDPSFGLVLVADCGVHQARLTVFDLGQNLLASHSLRLSMAEGPRPVLDRLADEAAELLAGLPGPTDHLITVVGLPGPVDDRNGTVVRPPIMPGWDGYQAARHLRDQLGGRVSLENDVNLRALGEARARPPAPGPLLFVKVGTGIGAGMVTSDGRLLRGADGAAGDIGHVRVPDATAPCACGNIGCLEAVAGLGALSRAAADLVGDGPDAVERFLQALPRREGRALELVQGSALAIGEVLAALVHMVNPSHIVLGGHLAEATDELLAGVRSVVYRRALPLATRNLTITGPVHPTTAGCLGGFVIGAEQLLQPDALLERLNTRQHSH